MATMYDITIFGAARKLHGCGRLDVSTEDVEYRSISNQDGSASRIARPVLPYAKGYVIFNEDVRFAELERLVGITIEFRDGNGIMSNLKDAFWSNGRPGNDRNGYYVEFSAGRQK